MVSTMSMVRGKGSMYLGNCKMPSSKSAVTIVKVLSFVFDIVAYWGSWGVEHEEGIAQASKEEGGGKAKRHGELAAQLTFRYLSEAPTSQMVQPA